MRSLAPNTFNGRMVGATMAAEPTTAVFFTNDLLDESKLFIFGFRSLTTSSEKCTLVDILSALLIQFREFSCKFN